MILDSKTQLAAAQDFSGSGGVTTNSIDLGNPTIKNRVGSGEALVALFVVTTPAAGDSGSFTDTFDFSVVEDTAGTLATAVAIETRRVPGAELVVGKIIEVPIPVGKPTKRYLGGKVAVGSGDTVSCDCYIVPRSHVQDYAAYAKGYSV